MAEHEIESVQLVVNLAKARELLLMDKDKFMPSGAAVQRDDMIATIEGLISHTLAAEHLPFPAKPADLDPISSKAWEYAAHVQPSLAATTTSSSYNNLQQVFAQRSDLGQAAELIDWIMTTDAFPQVKNSVIDDAKAACEMISHRLITQPETKQWMEDVEAHQDSLNAYERKNFTLMHKEWLSDNLFDEAFVDAKARAEVESYRVWVKTKKTSDFSTWLPNFETIVDLTRQEVEKLGQALGVTPYQAALDNFNPELKNDTVNTIFSDLRVKLPPLIKEITEKQKQQTPPIPLPEIPMADQMRVAKRLANAMGLEGEYTRIDLSAHPFSSGEWKDVRMTTRKEDSLLSTIGSLVHEAGHALYSRALPEEQKGQPLGRFQSMWVHETQSLFWEKQVLLSPEFMEFLSKTLKDELHVDGPAWAPENLHKLLTNVEPSLIRVEADEVTYPVHIIVRHNIEQKLMDGTLAPKDVPEVWAKEMKEMLGVDVPDHAHGCMQDVHWASGLIGYFPAYAFGALGAAQLMDKLKEEMPQVKEYIRTGQLAPIKTWLNERIHSQGSLYSGEELFHKVTGKPLSTDAWFASMRERYLGQDLAQERTWRAQATRDAGTANYGRSAV